MNKDVMGIPTHKEYYSAIKNKTLSFTTTWTDLEGIVLSEINHLEKYKYCVISLKGGI